MSDKVDEDIPDKVDIDVNDDAEEEQVKLPKLDLIMYTADELIELRTAVMSQTWPSYLDEAFKNNRGSWDPDRWHQNKKRGSTPPPSEGDKISEKGDRTKKDEANEAGINEKKDIKDRLFMAETEGVVLGPQRRSFITGCQMTKDPPKDADNLSGNSSNAASKSSSQDRGERGDHRGGSENSSLRSDSMSAANSRRVGSGRIRPQAAPEDYDRDGPSRGDRGDRDVGPRGERGGRSNYGERGDPASESRYGFNRGDRGDRDRGGWNDRDYDKGGRGDSRSDRGGRNMTSSRGGRYEQQGGSTGRPEHDPKGDRRGDPRNERGHRGSRRNEEPEWMSEPIKQDGELFELKGFDDSPEKETKLFQQQRSEIERKAIPQAKAPAKSVARTTPPGGGTTPATSTSGNNGGQGGGFNINDILHMDVIPGLSNILDDCNDPLMDTGTESQPKVEPMGGGSRFSQFFTKAKTEEKQQEQQQQQSAVQPHQHSSQSQKNLEHRRSSITDGFGNVNNNSKSSREGSPNAFMHQFLRTQQQKHHKEHQTSIKIPSPGDPSACFAPVSPAAKTENPITLQSANAINPIMEMLRAGNAKTESELLGGQKAPPLPQMPEVKTAAELEATIKQRIGLPRDKQQPQPSNLMNAEPRNITPQPQQSDASEVSAFKKFAAMMQGSNGLEKQNGNTSQTNDMNHHQQAHPPQDQRGLGHHQHQQQQPLGSQPHFQPMHRGPVIRPSPIPANAPTERGIHAAEAAMQQPQHPETFQRMPNPGMPNPGMPNPGMPNHQPNPGKPSKNDVLMVAAQRPVYPDLLNSQEAITLQNAVHSQGPSMLNQILYQFVYGQMEPRRREILLQVIKYYQMRGAFGHQFATPPHLLNVQDSMSPTSPTPTMNSKGCPGNAGGPGNGSGNLAVSPLPGRDRIPSPQEIAIHTQNIMQNALIKRKLEEQKDNFRRRQELDQQRKSTDSPSNAFMPTSVMKKMAADRRDSDPKPVIPELKVSQLQQPDKAAAMNMQNRHSPLAAAAAAAAAGIVPGPQGMIPRPMMPPAQQILFMQQQIRAQQLAAIQAGQPVDPRVLMHAQAMMGGGPPGSVHGPGGVAGPPRQLAPTSVPRFMPPDVMHGHHQQQALHQHPAAVARPGGLGGLSQFFSPEVLAQAQSGNAPPLPPLPTQKAMTLEEIERQAAAVRM